MKCFEWANKKIKNFKWYDMSLIKLSVAGFILMIVALLPIIASLSWYWYLIMGVVFAIRPVYILCKK